MRKLRNMPNTQQHGGSAVATRARDPARLDLQLRRVNGVDTLVRTSGQPRAEAVVFVHGFVGSSEDFRDLMLDVGELAYAVAPDMPNHGRSQRSQGFPCTVRGYADHLAAVLRRDRYGHGVRAGCSFSRAG